MTHLHYRVWDGEQMHYWDDEGISLTIEGENWYLYRKDTEFITSNKTARTALMWGSDQREQSELDIHTDFYKLGKRAGDIVQQEEQMLLLYDDPEPFIGEVKMIDGTWCIVNEKRKETRDLFSESAINKILGDIYQNPDLLEDAK
ncbi:YopX family protein [Bacillus sp. FSL M8-0168]|uniref:YopX family protein n=1 Tax=Bacillus sp. FSL M8-0168 TaxID=2921614 RepID=UPI0030FD2DEC